MFRRPIGVPGFVLAAAAGGALWLTGVAATAAPAPQDAPAASAYRPPPPPPQPIAYSHK